MPHCVAFECSIQAKNRKKDPKIRFHKFPDDVAIRRAWIHAVGRTSLPKDPRLCSKNFEEHCFEESQRLLIVNTGFWKSDKFCFLLFSCISLRIITFSLTSSFWFSAVIWNVTLKSFNTKKRLLRFVKVNNFIDYIIMVSCLHCYNHV